MFWWWYLNLEAAVYQSPQLLGFTACCERKPWACTVCCTAVTWNVPLLCQSGSLLQPGMTQQSQEISTEWWTPALSQVWSVFAPFSSRLHKQMHQLAYAAAESILVTTETEKVHYYGPQRHRNNPTAFSPEQQNVTLATCKRKRLWGKN